MLRSYLCRYGNELSGAIIMATGSESPALLKAGLFVIECLAAKNGWHHRSQFIDRLAFNSFNRKFGNKSGKDWLSRDTAEVKKYMQDPLCSFIFTLNAYHSLLKVMQSLTVAENLQNMPKSLPDTAEVKKYMQDPLCSFIFTLNAYHSLLKVMQSLTVAENLQNMPKSLPILFTSGDSDALGGFGTKVIALCKQFKKLGMQNVSCKLYKDYRHEILNELHRDVVYNDILNWLQKNINYCY